MPAVRIAVLPSKLCPNLIAENTPTVPRHGDLNSSTNCVITTWRTIAISLWFSGLFSSSESYTAESHSFLISLQGELYAQSVLVICVRTHGFIGDGHGCLETGATSSLVTSRITRSSLDGKGTTLWPQRYQFNFAFTRSFCL